MKRIMTDPWVPYPDLAALMTKAKAEGLWFHCSYQDLWFTPDQLETEWRNGRFRWGAVNWKLRAPLERRGHLEALRESAEAELNRIKEQLRDV